MGYLVVDLVFTQLPSSLLKKNLRLQDTQSLMQHKRIEHGVKEPFTLLTL
jgi:hypothetical protein